MRKITFKILFGLLITSGIFIGCQKEIETDSLVNVNKENYEITERDKEFSALAKAVAISSTQNREFRELLRKEALVMYDGDYDIRFFNLLEKELGNTEGKKSSSQFKVGNLLDNNLNLDHLNKKSGTKYDWDAYTSYLQGKYPKLQISIPVHAEDWEAGEYLPDVTFVPEDYDEQTTKELLAYNYLGETKTLDATKAPNKAVIVVGLCERTAEVYSTKKQLIEPPEGGEEYPPLAPSNLIASATSSGIHLQWSQSQSVLMPVNGYIIYRKSAHETSFSLISTTNSYYAKLYDDNNVTKNETYYYYVRAYNYGGYSPASNTVSITAPDFVEKLASYDAKVTSLKSIQHTWEYPTGEYYDEVILERGVNTTAYQNYKTFNSNDEDYTEENLTGGNQYHYKIYGMDSGKESDPMYDFVIVPHRDPTRVNDIKIKGLWFNNINDIEGWILGYPEFRVTVTKASLIEDEYETEQLSDELGVYFEFKTRGSGLPAVQFDQLIHSWLPMHWYDVLSINVQEEDQKGDTSNSNIISKYREKNTSKTAISALISAGVKLIKIGGDGNENCGTVHMLFTDPENFIYDTPNYGVHFDTSTTPRN